MFRKKKYDYDQYWCVRESFIWDWFIDIVDKFKLTYDFSENPVCGCIVKEYTLFDDFGNSKYICNVYDDGTSAIHTSFNENMSEDEAQSFCVLSRYNTVKSKEFTRKLLNR